MPYKGDAMQDLANQLYGDPDRVRVSDALKGYTQDLGMGIRYFSVLTLGEKKHMLSTIKAMRELLASLEHALLQEENVR